MQITVKGCVACKGQRVRLLKGLTRSLETPTHLLSGEYSHRHAHKGLFYFVTSMCVQMFTRACARVHVHMCMYTHARSCVRVHMCIFTCACFCVRIHMCPITCACGYNVPRGDQRTALVSLATFHSVEFRPPCYLLLCFMHQTSWPTSLQEFSCLCLPSHRRRARITGVCSPVPGFTGSGHANKGLCAYACPTKGS